MLTDKKRKEKANTQTIIKKSSKQRTNTKYITKTLVTWFLLTTVDYQLDIG